MSAARLLLAVSGLIVWSSGFVMLYAGLSIGCKAGVHQTGVLGANLLTALLFVVLIVHLAVLAGLQWHALTLWRRERGTGGYPAFLAALTCLVTAVGLAGMLAVGLPVLMVPPCD